MVALPLLPGQTVRAELRGTTLRVVRKLGEGTQGEVYLVEGPDGPQAVKWYKPDQATADQRTAVLYLVRTGPPFGPAGRRFIWPLDLVTAPDSRQFGYLMALIDTKRFAELGEVWAHMKPVPGFSALCGISYQLANSYRALHLSGHCYRDISAGNLMFDPKSGDVLICDNDNVGVNRQSHSQVWGTMEYMAPEIILGKALPSTETDLHSLAVLLFYLWVWHHPFHGEMEYRFHCWDIPAKKQVYGESPVFVFDAENAANRLPADPDYALARERWAFCPPALQEMFVRAFTEGIRNPGRRVTEGEWQGLFAALRESIVSCPKCRAANFADPVAGTVACWHCHTVFPAPAFLRIRRPGGEAFVALALYAQVTARHTGSSGAADDPPAAVGTVVPHPSLPGAAGIRNVSDLTWHAVFPDGTETEVPPGRAVPLNPGTELRINGAVATIVVPGGDAP